MESNKYKIDEQNQFISSLSYQVSLNSYISGLNFILLTKNLYGYQAKDFRKLFLNKWIDKVETDTLEKIEKLPKEQQDALKEFTKEQIEKSMNVINKIIEEDFPINLDPNEPPDKPIGE